MSAVAAAAVLGRLARPLRAPSCARAEGAPAPIAIVSFGLGGGKRPLDDQHPFAVLIRFRGADGLAVRENGHDGVGGCAARKHRSPRRFDLDNVERRTPVFAKWERVARLIGLCEGLARFSPPSVLNRALRGPGIGRQQSAEGSKRQVGRCTQESPPCAKGNHGNNDEPDDEMHDWLTLYNADNA